MCNTEGHFNIENFESATEFNYEERDDITVWLIKMVVIMEVEEQSYQYTHGNL